MVDRNARLAAEQSILSTFWSGVCAVGRAVKEVFQALGEKLAAVGDWSYHLVYPLQVTRICEDQENLLTNVLQDYPKNGSHKLFGLLRGDWSRGTPVHFGGTLLNDNTPFVSIRDESWKTSETDNRVSRFEAYLHNHGITDPTEIRGILCCTTQAGGAVMATKILCQAPLSFQSAAISVTAKEGVASITATYDFQSPDNRSPVRITQHMADHRTGCVRYTISYTQGKLGTTVEKALEKIFPTSCPAS
jgi:hypothetical protein